MNMAQLQSAVIAAAQEANVADMSEILVLIRAEDSETGGSQLVNIAEWSIGAQRDSGETNWVFVLTAASPDN